MEFLIAILLLVGLLVILGIIVYNKIVKLKVRVKEGWSDIQVQLKRRHNLISNLVETVKGYATHEKETLEKVVQARNAAQQAEGGNMNAVQSAERMLSSALSGLKINALAEAYPDLKANTNFLQLQGELADTENKIAASRRFYNTTVQSFNTYIQQIPGKFFAGMAGAAAAEFFEVEEDEQVKEVPQVDFHAKPDASSKAPKEAKEEEKAEVKAAQPAAAPSPKKAAPAPAPEAKMEEKPAEPQPKADKPLAQTKPAPVEEPKTEEPKEEEKPAEPAPVEEPKAEEKPEEPPKSEE